MIFAFDTETTGLPVDRLALDDPVQPHLVQLAGLLLDDDGTERASINLIVNAGVPIPKGASDVHGITNDVAVRAGMSNPVAVALWDRLAERADLLVAHNIKFDMALMETAWARVLSSRLPRLDVKHGSRPRFCTMEAASPIVNLPPTDRMRAAGFEKPKPPKLAECIRHFFNEPLDGAHDALVDVRATARLFFHLRSIGVAP